MQLCEIRLQNTPRESWKHFHRTYHTAAVHLIKKRNVWLTSVFQSFTPVPAVVMDVKKKTKNACQCWVSQPGLASHPLTPSMILAHRTTAIERITVRRTPDPRGYSWWRVAFAVHWTSRPSSLTSHQSTMSVSPKALQNGQNDFRWKWRRTCSNHSIRSW